MGAGQWATVDPTMLPNLGNSWTGSGGYIDQAKAFFSTLGHNFMDEFKRGGCVNEFFTEDLPSREEDLVAPGPKEEDIVSTGGNALAFTYAATRGLVVPLRSSIYRGILGGTETLAGAAPMGIPVIQEFRALVDEVSSFRQGTCK